MSAYSLFEILSYLLGYFGVSLLVNESYSSLVNESYALVCSDVEESPELGFLSSGFV